MSPRMYGIGDWFSVPLREGGYAVGIVARANRGGVLLGYFFGPRRTEIPKLGDVAGLVPDDAILVAKFGHVGLKKGSWPTIGRLDGWDQTQWPMPVFIRYEELTGRSFRVFYDDQDPNRLLREEQIEDGVVERGPQDGLMGAGFVEAVLSKLCID